MRASVFDHISCLFIFRREDRPLPTICARLLSFVTLQDNLHNIFYTSEVSPLFSPPCSSLLCVLAILLFPRIISVCTCTHTNKKPRPICKAKLTLECILFSCFRSRYWPVNPFTLTVLLRVSLLSVMWVNAYWSNVSNGPSQTVIIYALIGCLTHTFCVGGLLSVTQREFSAN